MTNISAIWQQAAPTTYQLSFPGFSTRAIQKKAQLLRKMIESFLGGGKIRRRTISRTMTKQKEHMD